MSKRVRFVLGVLLFSLSGCGGDAPTGSPPPPPPPPPPSPAEISIAAFVDPETGADLADTSQGIMVSGRFGVVIDFDTGSSQAQSLDLILRNESGATDVVPCNGLSAQGSTGLRTDVESVQCVIDSAEGMDPCQGRAMTARFKNGSYTITAELTLEDGTTVRDEGDRPLLFDNGEASGGMALDIGPRVVSVGDDFPDFGVKAGVPFWGGPRDLTWRACPVVFDQALLDICTIEISGGTLLGSGDLDLGNGPGERAASEAPFTYTAAYRDPDGEPLNEDLVEDDPTGGGSVIGDGPSGFRVLLCDGTNVTEFFGMQDDVRHLDMTAPRCTSGSCKPEIDGMTVLQNGLYSTGDFSLGGLADGGVGGIYGVTTIVDAYEFDSGDPDNQELFLGSPAAVAELPEDDGCGSGLTTNSNLQFGCAGVEAGVPVDAYFVVVSEVKDRLDHALGDGDNDIQIDDVFDNSEEFGTDFTSPETDEFAPPNDPTFVWNPDLGVDYSAGSPALILASRTCPSTNTALCESIMWEAVDPDLASGDDPSGVEDGSCVPGPGPSCADDDGDGDEIQGEITDAPASPPASDDNEDELLGTAKPAADMYEAFFCAGGGVGAACNGTDDGGYSVDIFTNDQAVKVNNVTTDGLSFILDTNPPVIGFGGITGLDASNAATVDLVLDASITDRNGDGTAVTSATVQVTIEGPLPGIFDGVCGTGDELDTFADVLVTPPNNPAATDLVIVDVTSQVNANGGDFSVTFTAQNQGGNLGLGDYTYCFEIVADDGAERKDGSDDGLAVSAFGGKDFNWQ